MTRLQEIHKRRLAATKKKRKKRPPAVRLTPEQKAAADELTPMALKLADDRCFGERNDEVRSVALDELLAAISRYDGKTGTLEGWVRQQIRFAILHHFEEQERHHQEQLDEAVPRLRTKLDRKLRRTEHTAGDDTAPRRNGQQAASYIGTKESLINRRDHFDGDRGQALHREPPVPGLAAAKIAADRLRSLLTWEQIDALKLKEREWHIDDIAHHFGCKRWKAYEYLNTAKDTLRDVARQQGVTVKMVVTAFMENVEEGGKAKFDALFQPEG